MPANQLFHNLLILISVSFLVTCAQTRPPGDGTSPGYESRICTQEFSPRRCTAIRLKNGEAVNPAVSVEGGNACEANYALQDAASARGLNIADLDYACEGLPVN